jgi:hypothetical protein
MPALNVFQKYAEGQAFADKREQNELARQQQAMQIDNQKQADPFQAARVVNSFLKVGQAEKALDFISKRVGTMEQLGDDTRNEREIADYIARGDISGAVSLLNDVEKVGVNAGFLNDMNNTGVKSSKQAYFNDLVKIAESDPAGETMAGKAALIELGVVSRASTSAAERIASNENLANSIADSERLKAQAKEEGKSAAQLRFKPLIQSAIATATKEAESRGESLSKLGRLNAALPGLQEVTSQLRELSEISTSTMGGRFFDKMVQETGFGSTKGGTARSKLISIVNNQVLPLLKETFGGAMSEKEGERLIATMGDPDATHDSRMGALDAFIAQKAREIQGINRELASPQLGGNPAQPNQVIKFDAQGNQIQ